MVSTLNQPIQINWDNESAIKLAIIPVFHARSKHIETHYHLVREKVLSQDVELQKIHTNEQVANIFTKSLVKVKFEALLKSLAIIKK